MRKLYWGIILVFFLVLVGFLLTITWGGRFIEEICDKDVQDFIEIDIGPETSSIACRNYCEDRYQDSKGRSIGYGLIKDGHCICQISCQ